MKEILEQTKALQRITRAYVMHDYTVWFSFQTDIEKVEAKRQQWAEQYGTELPAWKRQDKKEKGFPTATATCTSVLGKSCQRELILMATPLALSAHPASPWVKQPWKQGPPECGIYVMVREPRNWSGYSWT